MARKFNVVVYALRETTDLKHGVSAWACSFMYGLHRHGIRSTTVVSPRDPKAPVPCDLAVIWGVRDTHIIDYYNQTGTPFICIERGFIPNRSKWSMAGYGGLNGLSNFCNENSPADRYEKYYTGLLQPWDTTGKYVLILGQTPGDSALYGLDVNKWVDECIGFFKEKDIPYVYRPHPGECIVTLDVAPGLKEAVQDAFCVVTYNSSAGVQSILAGKPTISMHKGSMVWGITKHTLEDCLIPHTPDRARWLINLAYTQWRMEEMANGDTWEHLKKYYD